ncbi:MAG: hypothetical protein HFF87_04290 [Oscillibacter sp.]|nr:hypothetical protein [Oscillibacter sp.]
MDWSKLNWDEARYFCHTGNPSFRTYDFPLQLEELVLMFHYYGIQCFTVQDIQEFYQKMQIPKPKSQGFAQPLPGRIRRAAAKINSIQCAGDGLFEIVPAEIGLYLPFDSNIYRGYIETGYRENRI